MSKPVDLQAVGTPFTLGWQFTHFPPGAKAMAQVAGKEGDPQPHPQPDDQPQMRPVKVDGSGKAVLTIDPKYAGRYLITLAAWDAKNRLITPQEGTTVLIKHPVTVTSFDVNPKQVKLGQEVTLSWSVEHAEGRTLIIHRNNPNGTYTAIGIDPADAAAGTMKDAPEVVGSQSYELWVHDSDGPLDDRFSKHTTPIDINVVATPPVERWPDIFPKRTGLQIVDPRGGGGVDRTAELNQVLDRALPPVDPAVRAASFGYSCARMARVTQYTSPAPPVPAHALDLAAEINEFRRRVPVRPIRPDPANDYHGNSYWRDRRVNPGNVVADSTPEAERSRANNVNLPSGYPPLAPGQAEPPWDQPTADDPHNIRGKWKVFQELIPAEGPLRCITAYGVDDQLTIGPGFATSGFYPQRLLHMLGTRTGWISTTARRIGLVAEAHPTIANQVNFVVADTTTDPAHPCRLEGEDAKRYIACSFELMSFFANLLIGAQVDLCDPPQTVDPQTLEQQTIDVLWELACGPGGAVADVPIPTGGDIKTEALACHAIHNSSGTRSTYTNKSSIAAVMDALWAFEKNRRGFPQGSSAGDKNGPRATYNVVTAVCKYWGSPAIAVLNANCQKDAKPKLDGSPVELPPPPGWPWSTSSAPAPK